MGGGGVGLMMREIIPYQRKDVILQPWPIGLGTLNVLVKDFFCESRQLPIVKDPKKNLINLFSSPTKQHRLGGKGGGGGGRIFMF